MKRKTKKKVWKIVRFISLCMIAVIMLMPLIYMCSTALKTDKEIKQYPPRLIPQKIEWRNVVDVFSYVDLIKYGSNSIFVTALVVVFWTLSSSMVAFGFARYRARGREAIFTLLLATIMIPLPALIIPQFLMFNYFGWIDTYLPLIIPTMFGSSYYIFMLRQFYGSLGNDLFEAARIDGCSEFRQWWSIGIPLCLPALSAVAIFAFIWTWNDLLSPVIYLNSMDKFTLPIALVGMQSMYTKVRWNMIMMAGIFTVLPIVLLFVFCQKFFIESIATTGIKG